MAFRPAVKSPDPNSRPPELKCSIKLESSMHRRTLCSKFLAGKHLWIQAAVTVPHGNIQFGGLVRPGRLTTHSQINILRKSLARLNLPMLLMRGMMTTFQPEPENASHDNVDDFNEDTCEVCFYDVLLRTMLRFKSCLKTIETDKAESKDVTGDKVEDFNEDTCNAVSYTHLTLPTICSV